MYRIFGIILILISFAISFNSYEKFLAIHNGNEIIVTVTDIPVSCKVSNKTLKAYFRFEYNGKSYTKMIKGKYCNSLKINKKITLKTNNNNSIFVYPEERLTMQYISIIVLFLVGLISLIKKNNA